MLAIPALYRECCSFRGECGGTNDDSGYADEVGYVGGVEIADGDLGDGGVDEKLVLWYGEVASFL